MIQATICTLGLLAGMACAQQVGVIDLRVSNPASYGSATLQARLYYPAKTSAPQAPIELGAGPRAAVVFLAGYNFLGRDYDALARHLVARGYLAIMNETAPYNGALLGDDGKAWFTALERENQRPGSFLYKAVDTARAAILGHSMGGANVYRVLAEQPGYKVGAALAPLIVPPVYTAKVARPLAVIAGAGDTVTPWNTHAKPSWDALAIYRGTKIFYLLDGSAHHFNLALSGYPGETALDQAIFARSSDVALSFFDHYLLADSGAFDHCVGTEARSEAHLQRLWSEARDPVLFEHGEAKLGRYHEIVTSGEPGLSVQLIAAAKSEASTPLGDFLLDPLTTMVLTVVATAPDGLGRFAWTVPNQAQFAGMNLHLQGLAQVRGGAFAFTNGLHVVVQP